VESNLYTTDFKGGQSFGERQGSCRGELLGHIIAVDECHLRRLLYQYIHYYHGDLPVSWQLKASESSNLSPRNSWASTHQSEESGFAIGFN
jgi:hypothetical protein